MAKKQKKSKKQTKKSAIAGLVKAVAATAANAAQSTKTYKNTVKKSAAPSAKSLVQQGVNAAASAAARQAAAAAAAKRKQEQKRAAARNATASSMQNTKNQQKKRSGLVLSQNRANGNKQKTGLVLPGLAGQKRDAKKEYEKFKEQHGTKAGNQKNRNKSGKKEKSGLVLAQRRTPGTLPQTGKNLYQAGKRQMNKSITDEESVKKAIKEGKSISALGTKKKKHNETYDTKRGTSNAILKMGNIASGAAMSATAEQTMRKSFTNPTGHHSTKNNKYWKSEEGQKRLDEFFASEEGKKAVADYQKEIKKSVKKANKQIDKNRPAKIDYSYEDMTAADYNKLATAAQQGRLNEVLKSDKKLANKVADINVKDYVKSAGVMGALDQMTQGLSVSQNPVYNYSKSQKQIMEKQKETTGYNVGRMVGGAIEFGLGGTGTLGAGLAKTGGKLALTNAAKQGGKTLAKTAAKNVGKEVAADAVVSLPLNSLDALKASYKDGKFDKKTFAKELALNVGGDILIGGGVSGITHGLSARQARNFNRINKTLEKGGTVSKQEMKFYDKHLNELADEIDAAVKAQDGITKSTSASAAANATAKAKGGTSASAVTNAEVKEYARLKGKQNAGVKLTAEEQKSMNRIVAKAVNDNVEKFVNKAVEEVRAARASGEGAIANEAEKLELEKARQEAVIDNSNNPAEIAVAKAKLNEVNAKLDRYKAEHGEKIKKYADADAQAQRLEVGSSGTLNARTPSAEGMTSSADNISDSTQNVNPRGAETDITHKLTNEKVSAEYSNALKKLENGDPVTLEEYLSIPEIREAKNRVAAGSSSDIPDSIRGQHRYDVTKKMSEYGSAEVKIIDGKEKVEYTGSVNRDRRADIILGLPASGKSSAIVDPISQKYKSKLIDSDEAKKMLDGFDDGWGAGYVHKESSVIVKKVLAGAIDMGENVVIPKVGGDYIGIEKLRQMLKKNGYSVNIHLCELDPNKAAGRNLRRFATTGRFVDLEATSFKYQNKPTEVYEQLVKEGNIDGYTRTSNDVGYGELPVQREGTEAISYNWRNDRRGGSDDGRGRAEIHRRIQEEPAGLAEKTPGNAGALDAPSFNAREAKLQEANNNVPFKDYSNNELELLNLRKEHTELKYKMWNTKNAEHYAEYVKRMGEVEDRIEELNKIKGTENIVAPTKETAEKADDLTNAARGLYAEDVKALMKGNSRTYDNFRRLFVDTFDGFEQFAAQLPKEEREKFKAQINAARNAKNKAGGWISERRVNVNGQITGESFMEIMGDMLKRKNANKYNDFQYYCANKHNIDRYANGKGIFGDSISAEDSMAICEHLEGQYPDFRKKQQQVVDYFKDLQQYRIDAGLVSKSSSEYMDALYPNYVPTYRVKNGQRENILGSQTNNTVQMGAPIKEATGGSAELLPLHEQVANLTEYTMKLGEQNRLFNLVAAAQGIDAKMIAPDVKLDDAVEACTLAAKVTDGATNKFYATFYDNGLPRKVEISEQMYLGIREWRNDPDSLAAMFNWKAKPLRAGNALFKNLITGWNPIFGAKNIVKDTGEALIYTKNVRGFIASYPKAIASVVRKKSKYNKYFDLYQACGGKYAHIREDIKTFNTDSTFKKVIKSPLTACQRFNDCLEAIPRMAEFISTIDNSLNAKAVFKNGGNVDDVLKKMDANTVNKALYNANEITLNFGRSGIAAKALNGTIVPYLNPAIQGFDKLCRVFKEAGADGVKGMFGLVGKVFAFAVTPAIFNEVMMTLYGGDDYQILNTRDKDNYYLIPMGDGKFIKIPKSRVGSALSSPFAHIYRHAMYGDPMEWKELFSNAWSNVGVMNPLENTLFSPIMMALMNKTWYGGDIENANDLDLRRTGQNSQIFDENTSAIAIWIGDKLNMSPKKIDYIIDSYTGVIGDFLIPATSQAGNHNPFYKNFIIDSVFSNRLSTDFWEKNADMEARGKVKGGKAAEKYEEWKSEYMYDAMTINQAIHDIDNDKSLSRKEKLEKKRELRKGLNQLYSGGLTGKSVDIEPVKFIAKQIGADKALKNYLPDSKNKEYSFKEHYKEYKNTEDYANKSKAEQRKIAQDFLNTYSNAVNIQKKISIKYHNTPDWDTIAVANACRGGRDSISLSCGVYESAVEEAKIYVKYNGNARTFITTKKRVNKIENRIENQGTDTSSNLYKRSIQNGVTALSLASSPISFKDRAYYITGSDGKMNAARGLMGKYGWTINEFINLGFSADADGNTYLKKQEVINAINNSKASTREEKAILFNLLYGDESKNPFGSIGDFSISGDTGITKEREKKSSAGKSSRKGYGRSSRKSSKASKATAEKPAKSNLPSWEDYVKDYITEVEGVSGVKFKDWDSPLDQAYRNKINSILKKMDA